MSNLQIFRKSLNGLDQFRLLRDPTQEEIIRERSRGFHHEHTFPGVSDRLERTLGVLLDRQHVFCPDIDDEIYLIKSNDFRNQLVVALKILIQLDLLFDDIQ